MIDIKRDPSENLKQYQIRLYRNKDIYGLTNIDIGELLNKETGQNYDESKYRKYALAYIDGWDDCLDEHITDNEVLAEIDKKKEELYKQQVKTRDKLRELRKHLRDEARIENLQDVFIECANIISKENPLELNTYPQTDGDKVAVLQLSDLHYGEIVENFMNTYNNDIFDERMNKLTTDVIRYCKLMGVDTLKVLNQGDLISGNIHVSTRVISEEDSVYQTMYVAETLANMILEFAKNINQVEFYSVTDNHSRINKNKKEHIEKESFSRFIPWHLKTRLSNINNIKIIENKINDIEEFDIGIIDIFHERAIFTHGHNGRINTTISDLALMTRVFPIAVFVGHYHKNLEDETHSIDLIMNPSGIGTGEYAKNIRKSSKPRQKMTIFENNDGNVERVSTFYINL